MDEKLLFIGQDFTGAEARAYAAGLAASCRLDCPWCGSSDRFEVFNTMAGSICRCGRCGSVFKDLGNFSTNEPEG